MTTGRAIDVTGGALTTGSLMLLNSASTSADTRVLFKVTNDHTSATGTTAICAQSDAGRGVFIDSNLAAGGYALEIDSEHTTANTAKIASAVTTGTILDIQAEAITTGKAINIYDDSLQTGSILYIDSDSAHNGTRSIVTIINNNATATGAIPLHVKQDSTNVAGKFEAQTSVVIPVEQRHKGELLSQEVLDIIVLQVCLKVGPRLLGKLLVDWPMQTMILRY